MRYKLGLGTNLISGFILNLIYLIALAIKCFDKYLNIVNIKLKIDLAS